MTPTEAYRDLLERLRQLQVLGSIGELLAWDEQVNLPPGGADLRAEQQGAMAEVTHAAASDPRLGEVLAVLETSGAASRDAAVRARSLSAVPSPVDVGQAVADVPAEDVGAVVRQARRDYDRATKLPAAFVREKAAQASRGYHAWARARAAGDFAGYAPVLEQNLELARREAAYLGWGDRAYDYMIDRHDPGLTAALIAPLFAELKTALVPLVREITTAAARQARAALRGFPAAGQREFLREVTEQLGFDFRHGRIDVSLHPFCLGPGADVRMTTRFKEDEPLDSLFSAIHETGHGMYEQGLPASHRGTALGLHAGMGAHESQSRLWENQVARSRGFWQFFEPRFRARFPEQTAALSSAALYRAINAVEPTLIRVDADEVTYNLHIILRFELEQKLFSGALAVRDLPQAWNEAARELLGLVPRDDREGVLQDVHWSDGSFGYFPSYTLGNLFAAQLWYRALAERPGLEEDFARGDFSWLLGWLRREVHARGRRLELPQLAREVTGEPLSPWALVRYLRDRYGTLFAG